MTQGRAKRMRIRLLAHALAAAALVAALALPARASFNPTDPPSGEHTQTDGPRYWVGKITLSYAHEHPLQPPISLITGADYALGQASDGYVGARRGGKNVWFHLPEFGDKEAVPIYATGLQDLCEQIVAELGARALMGVYVAPSPDDIDAQTGADARAEGDTDLHLVIQTGRVQAVRTFQAPALGDGKAAANAQPVPDKEAIAERSPLQPVGAGDPLDKNQLDAYVARLNRQPGRMVDAVVTPTLTPGAVNLDYLVQEDRPWTVSSDFSNTGTDATGKDRQHFAFADYQLTGHDDVLLVDYLTSGFSDTNAVTSSYELRVPRFDGLRFRLGGDWSTYASDQFGFSTVVIGAPTDPNSSTKVVRDKLHFSGTQWDVNGLLIQNLIGRPGFFLDTYFGTRFFSDRPLRPHELTQELAWRFSGQTSLGTRLIPQVEGVLGGLVTVRGYPQSIAAGDSFVNGSLEYRYHIPLGFRSVEPWQLPWVGTFRPGPDDMLRLPDWDLVVATFVDAGQVWNQDRVLGEHDDALASVGLGLEVIVRRNFSLRVDYGVALLPIPNANVNRYDGEFNFSALLRY